MLSAQNAENLPSDPPSRNLASWVTDKAEFSRWCAMKFDGYVADAGECIVEIGDPGQISRGERDRITALLGSNNFFVYQYNQDIHGNTGYLALARQLGLVNPISNPGSGADGISLIQVVRPGSGDIRPGYIPYSSRALNWHTDGYYNEESRKVRAFLLHCENPALTGGENSLLDHELVYAWMRKNHSGLCAALEDTRCLTVPGNSEPGIGFSRDTYRGAVFTIDPQTGSLYMRFTQRKKHIQWQPDTVTSEAVATLNEALEADALPVITLKLARGQGIICNNVLHSRSRFSDTDDQESKRCLHRIRYAERVRPGELEL